MEYVASYALLSQCQKEPTAESISALLRAAGGEVDSQAIASFVQRLDGRSYADILNAGASMMTIQAAAPVAGGSAPAAQASAPAPAEDDSDSNEIELF